MFESFVEILQFHLNEVRLKEVEMCEMFQLNIIFAFFNKLL